MIVVDEELHLLGVHVLGEHWVDEEDWGLELLVGWVDRLEVSASREQRLHLGLLGEDWVLDGSLSDLNSLGDELISSAELELLGRSWVVGSARVSELNETSLEVGVVRVVRVLEAERSLLHQGRESLGVHGHGNTGNSRDHYRLHVWSVL